MNNPGKLVILTMVGVAIVAATFSTWYHYRSVHRSQDFWGTHSAVLIAQAPRVRILQLGEAVYGAAPRAETAGKTPAAVEFDGRSSPVVSAKQADSEPELNNVRRALVQDATFDWTRGPATQAPQWQYALEFDDGHNETTVLFDFGSRRVALAGSNKLALLDPVANETMHALFDEEMNPPPADSTDAAKNAPPAEASEEAAKRQELP